MTSGTPDLEVDSRFDPGERPPAILAPVRRMLYEEEEEAERERRASKQTGRGKGKLAAVDAGERPIMPAWPLVSGILPFLFYPGTPACWLALSLGLSPLLALGLDGLSGWLGSAPSEQALFTGTMELVVAGFFGLIWSAYAASVFLTVVSESSCGNEQIADWPSANLLESMPELWHLMVTVSCGSVAGWVIGIALFPDAWSVAALGIVSLWLCFPIVLLSQLAGASTVALLDGRVLASLPRRALSWLLYYLETAVMAALCAASVAAALLAHYLVIAVFAPLYVACLLLSARLIGRLAWRIAEATPASGKPAAQEK